MPASKQLHTLPPRTKGLLLPVLLSIISFIAGILCTAFFNPVFRMPSMFPPTSFNTTVAFTAPDKPDQGSKSTPAPPLEGHVEPPLGLQWFKSGYANPWTASVQRTGIEDLNEAFKSIVERDGELPRVVVSFTSLPKRFVKHARSMIEILKKQTYLPDMIYVCIPEGSRRSDAKFDVPKWITEDPLITVLPTKVDMGPATKLIPALEHELKLGNTRTRIVTVDDDNDGHWSQDSLLSLYAYSLYFEDAAIGLTGWNVTCMTKNANCGPEDSGVPKRQFPERKYNFIKQADDYACHSLSDWLPDYYANCIGAIRKNFIGYADVIEGYKGALYQPRFFDVKQLKTLMDKTKTPEYFFLCDDVWFSGWLSMKNVPRIIVNPAIHNDAQIRVKLMEESDSRNLSRDLLPMGKPDVHIYRKLGEPEGSLHDMGGDFVKANHDGVLWFEERGGWTKGMWDKPSGFQYPSELKRAGGTNTN